MRQEVITKKTKSILLSLAKDKILGDFYLAGGTALALQYGHRKSIDLDFFNKNSFDTKKLKTNLARYGKIIIDSEEKDTLNLRLNETKISFLGYPYKAIFPLKKLQGIKLADPRDIACMKLDAVSSRGCKKDFIDLYFLMQDYSFENLMEFFDKKYKNIRYNKIHIIKSLTYFADADKENMPIMLKKASWQEVKNFFKKLAEFIVIL